MAKKKRRKKRAPQPVQRTKHIPTLKKVLDLGLPDESLKIKKKKLSNFINRVSRTEAIRHGIIQVRNRKNDSNIRRDNRQVRENTRKPVTTISAFQRDAARDSLRREICKRRSEKRRMLFAKGKAGKGKPGPKYRILKPESLARCK